jgi:hypothetical protein
MRNQQHYLVDQSLYHVGGVPSTWYRCSHLGAILLGAILLGAILLGR